ncbi:hypothetical protein PFISCL1PPCAC_18707, partial [Pristionchus fissidentatus]
LTLLLAIIISHRYIRLALNLSRVVSCLDRISADVLVLEVWDRQPILAISQILDGRLVGGNLIAILVPLDG